MALIGGTMSEAFYELIEFMRANGAEPASPTEITPGRFCRFDIAGEPKGKKSGWIIFHDDEHPTAKFGNHKVHDQAGVVWTKKGSSSLSKNEKRILDDKIKEREEEFQRLKSLVREKVAAEADRLYRSLPKAQDDHPYLERKKIKAHTAKIDGDRLVIPILKDGKIRNLQTISPDGQKLFERGGEVQGCYSNLGKPTDRLFICEGFATGATLYEITGTPVVIAFNAGNLEAVALAMRARLPDAEITIAADNDRFTKEPIDNPGLTYARRAAKAIDAQVVCPFFDSSVEKLTDFNDLANLVGAEETKRQLGLNQLEPIKSELVEIENEEMRLRYGYRHMRRDKDGSETTPLATEENVEDLLFRIGAIARYDVIKKEPQVFVKGLDIIADKQLIATLTHIKTRAVIARMATDSLIEIVMLIAARNHFNPVATWITSKPWDGIDRLPAFFGTVKAFEEDKQEVKELKETLMKRWMISAIAAAVRPKGVSAHGVLVFRAAQYLGKTAWFKSLAPADMRVISDGLTLDLKDKDSIFRVISNWLVELGEIDATFRKSDIAALKAFITRDVDVIRRPYDKAESEFPRRTVFFGSVNEHRFLHDPTGNRRYWTIDAEEINHRHGLDMQQVWAQFYQLYLSGESWYLTESEMMALNASNKDHEQVDPIFERIESMYDWEQPSFMWRKLSATQIAQEIGISNPEQKHTRAVAAAVHSITGSRSKKHGGRLVFEIPSPKRPI